MLLDLAMFTSKSKNKKPNSLMANFQICGKLYETILEDVS